MIIYDIEEYLNNIITKNYYNVIIIHEIIKYFNFIIIEDILYNDHRNIKLINKKNNYKIKINIKFISTKQQKFVEKTKLTLINNNNETEFNFFGLKYNN